jgi:hypothetical protein
MSHVAKDTRKPSARRHANRVPREYQHPVYSGRDYLPCRLSQSELEKLHSEIIQGHGNAVLANKEVERVAHNIAVALGDGAKPLEVREAVREYAVDLLRHLDVEADFVRDPEFVYALLPVACRRISRIPFIPDRSYIEALTGKDREAAMLAARSGRPQ